MNLIPKVKTLETRSGFLVKKAICFSEENLDSRLVMALKKLPCEPEGVMVEVCIDTACTEDCEPLQDKTSEGYELNICNEHICIRSSSIAGAFYAIQTLRQLFKQENVPCLYIKDWPDFSHRGFYHDVTRGRIPTVETLKKLIDDMAYYKMNSLQLYVEHVFEFRETKDLWASFGCLTEQEMKEIDEYCQVNFIDFIPSLSTFGHLYELLEQPKFKHLRVLKDYETIPNFWHARMRHHTMDPLNSESLGVVKSLIDQYAPCFTSKYFNICCDETFDLQRYAEEGYDVGQIYVDFVKRIVRYVQNKDKTVMMWADILLEHPETIAQLPEDIVFLNWYYEDKPRKIEEKIKKFAQFGRKQMVCPGTSSWYRFCENTDKEEINISEMIEMGHKYGAVGVLNTNWGDWGNPCSLELGMYGLVLGAEKSWSVNTELNGAFYDAVNELLYGSENGIRSLKAISELHNAMDWRLVCQNYFALRYEKGDDMKFISEEEVTWIQKRYLNIKENLSKEHWEQDEYRKEMLIAAEGICVMAELTAALAGYEAGKEKKRVTNTEHWMEAYSESWMRKNKSSELYRIREMFEYEREKI